MLKDRSADLKRRIAEHWNQIPIGTATDKFKSSHHKYSPEYFEDIEKFRYQEYASWLPTVVGFNEFSNQRGLEIGCGLGIDLAQFIRGGSRMSAIDLATVHIHLASLQLSQKDLAADLNVADAERLPFADDSFDFVFSNGVLHHTPNTAAAFDEIWRVLKPNGKIVILLYHQNSLQYWLRIVLHWSARRLVKSIFYRQKFSFQQLLNQVTDGVTNPLTKVYTRKRGKSLCHKFEGVTAGVYHLNAQDFPLGFLFPQPWLDKLSRRVGWYLVLRAHKPSQKTEVEV